MNPPLKLGILFYVIVKALYWEGWIYKDINVQRGMKGMQIEIREIFMKS